MCSLTPNMGDLVQWEHPKIRVEQGWGQEHIKIRVQNRTKVTITELHTRFRLAPNLLTLDDLERRKRPLAKVN